MAKDEVEWQQRNTKREIDVLSDDIRGLKQAITDKDKPLEVSNYTPINSDHLIISNECTSSVITSLCWRHIVLV